MDASISTAILTSSACAKHSITEHKMENEQNGTTCTLTHMNSPDTFRNTTIYLVKHGQKRLSTSRLAASVSFQAANCSRYGSQAASNATNSSATVDCLASGSMSMSQGSRGLDRLLQLPLHDVTNEQFLAEF